MIGVALERQPDRQPSRVVRSSPDGIAIDSTDFDPRSTQRMRRREVDRLETEWFVLGEEIPAAAFVGLREIVG